MMEGSNRVKPMSRTDDYLLDCQSREDRIAALLQDAQTELQILSSDAWSAGDSEPFYAPDSAILAGFRDALQGITANLQELESARECWAPESQLRV